MEVVYKSKDGKIYTSKEECKNADSAWQTKVDEEQKTATLRKEAAKELNDAIETYNKNHAERVKADNAEVKQVQELKRQFITKFGPFHMTYSVIDDDLVESVFNTFFNLF